MRAAALCVSLLVAAASAQGPGDGVSKTTVASSWPWPGKEVEKGREGERVEEQRGVQGYRGTGVPL